MMFCDNCSTEMEQKEEGLYFCEECESELRTIAYACKKETEDVKKLADDHANYIGQLLEAHHEPADIISKCLYHYKTAFIHGYKHAIEAAGRD